MSRRIWLGGGAALALLVSGGVYTLAQNKPKAEPKERTLKESEVPPAALAALKKLAGTEKITHFEETIDHGHKLYEGSYMGPDGMVDAEVTESGDVMEIEAAIAASKVPASVMAAAQKESGKDAKLSVEKVTMTLYEIHYKKDGHGHELVYTPAGERYHEPGEAKEKDEDDGD